MNSTIVVYRYQDSTSDKCWAFDTAPNADQTHTVYFGRWGNQMLQTRNIPATSARTAQARKTKKGYVLQSGLTVDESTRRLVNAELDEPSNTIEELPECLWYRMDAGVPGTTVFDYLNTTLTKVTALDKEAAIKLTQLPAYQALRSGKKTGGAEYKEGPLALLLMFGLRRHLTLNIGNEEMLVSDEESNLLSRQFDDLGTTLTNFNIAYCLEQGWLDVYVADKREECVAVMAKKHQMTQYSSIKAINALAIACGCIEKPIDLAVIQSEQKSAYF